MRKIEEFLTLVLKLIRNCSETHLGSNHLLDDLVGELIEVLSSNNDKGLTTIIYNSSLIQNVIDVNDIAETKSPLVKLIEDNSGALHAIVTDTALHNNTDRITFDVIGSKLKVLTNSAIIQHKEYITLEGVSEFISQSTGRNVLSGVIESLEETIANYLILATKFHHGVYLTTEDEVLVLKSIDDVLALDLSQLHIHSMDYITT